MSSVLWRVDDGAVAFTGWGWCAFAYAFACLAAIGKRK